MNLKRQRFVEAYLTTAAGNATKAAEIAGYSPRSARINGSRLLTFADVRQALDARTTELKARANSDADQLIAETKACAFTKVEITERGKLKSMELYAKLLKLIDHHRDATPNSGITVNIGYIGLAPDQSTLQLQDVIDVTPTPQT